MIISDYTVVTPARILREDILDCTFTSHNIDRPKGEIYLYNKLNQLVNTLKLSDFRVLNKRKKIPHKDRFIEVQDGPKISVAVDTNQANPIYLARAIWLRPI